MCSRPIYGENCQTRAENDCKTLLKMYVVFTVKNCQTVIFYRWRRRGWNRPIAYYALDNWEMDCWGQSATPILNSQYLSHNVLLICCVGRTWAWTRDLLLRRPELYRLSYTRAPVKCFIYNPKQLSVGCRSCPTIGSLFFYQCNIAVIILIGWNPSPDRFQCAFYQRTLYCCDVCYRQCKCKTRKWPYDTF